MSNVSLYQRSQRYYVTIVQVSRQAWGVNSGTFFRVCGSKALTTLRRGLPDTSKIRLRALTPLSTSYCHSQDFIMSVRSRGFLFHFTSDMQSSNKVLHALRSSPTAVTFGAWQMLPGANLARTIARCGYDWVCVDGEHGNIDGRFKALCSGGRSRLGTKIMGPSPRDD